MRSLAEWAAGPEPTQDDLALARSALLDTLAVTLAGGAHPLAPVFDELSPAGRWAARAHVLDFDDLHMPSTTHISAVCVPAALAAGGGARAYLAGAGVMARLGTALGWRHYRAGWHATCTAGAPAAAVAAAVALGLDAERIGVAMALAVPAAGGVQRAFGTSAKALQVGFAAEAGLRAARLAQAGATADPSALEDWLALVGGDPAAVSLDGPAIPDGLAVKLYPCCYALQRPMSAVAKLPETDPEQIDQVIVRTPEGALQPLIHHAPRTGLEGKFSLEYGIAAAILDHPPGLGSFGDEAVSRPAARRLMERVTVAAQPGGDGLLDGEVEIEIRRSGGEPLRTSLALPPGAPGRPATEDELAVKLETCAGEAAQELRGLDWDGAPAYLTRALSG
ncbi:MAG TPA: MmgE/PrpD family protein [Solirubrobacteraceae bacterium]|nr:MmgE/PrpD family protein [Solirubrobacteraceae bacterium]